MSKEYPCIHYDNEKCEKFSVGGVTSYCVKGPCPDEAMSNSDHIRSMTDEELAEMLLEESETGRSYCDYCDKSSLYAPHCTAGSDLRECCIKAIGKWLKQPYGGGGNE